MVAEENLKAHLLNAMQTLTAAERAILALIDENRKLRLEALTMPIGFEIEVVERLRGIERTLNRLMNRSDIEIGLETLQMINLSKIGREVTETRGAAASAKLALEKLSAKIKELADQMTSPEDQAAVDALADELDAAQADIAAAIAANPGTTGPTGTTGATGSGETGATGDTGATGPA